MEDWKKVVRSYETKVNLLGSDGRKWVWKKAGEGLSDRYGRTRVRVYPWVLGRWLDLDQGFRLNSEELAKRACVHQGEALHRALCELGGMGMVGMFSGVVIFEI